MQITRLVEVDRTLFAPRVLIDVPTSGVKALSRLLRLSLHLSIIFSFSITFQKSVHDSWLLATTTTTTC